MKYPSRILLYSLLIVLCLISFPRTVSGKPKIILEASPLVKLDLHYGNFKGLPGYDCCSEFSKGTGFGYSLSFGAAYSNLKSLLNTNFGIFLNFSFASTNGKFQNDDYFADVIIGNDVFKGISQHTLETSIQYAGVSSGIYLNNILGINPLSGKIGIDFLFPVSSNFSQRETLISPKEAKFENGTKIRNYFTGKVPELIMPKLYLSLHLGWELIHSKSFTISPLTSFNLPLNQNVNRINWKTFSFAAGINIQFRPPKAKIPLPTPPPPTDFPQPFEPKPVIPINARIDVESIDSGKVYENFDTIQTISIVKTTVELQPTPLMIFYKKNDFLFGFDDIPSDNEFRQIYSENREVLNVLLEYLKKNPNSKISLLCSQSDDEIPNACEQRIARLVEFFNANGYSENISKVEKFSPKAKKQIPELIDENRFVQIILNGNEFIISNEKIIQQDTQIVPSIITIKTKVEDNIKVKLNGKILINGFEQEFNSSAYQFSFKDNLNLTDSLNKTLKIKVELETSEEFSRRLSLEKELIISSTYKDTIIYNYFNPFQSQNSILVALFNFDESDYYWVNPKLKQITDELKKQEKNFSIVGSVDNIGTEEHNQKLALARAKRVGNLLGNDIPLKTIESGKFKDNNTPIQRLLNRSAWIVVE